MKKMKKIMALLFAMVMTLAMSTTALAGTITVDNVLKGETYKAYKILEYESNTDKTAYSYYLETSNTKTTALKTILETAGFTFTASSDGSQYVLNTTNMDANAIVSALKSAGLTSENALAYSEKTATNNEEAVFTDLASGYWFVTTTTGSLCSLATYDDEAVVVEKNTVPTEDKKQSTTSEGIYTNDEINVSVGDKVYYEIIVNDGKGTDSEITITDTMSNGLTNNKDYVLYKNSVAEDNRLTKDTNYTVSDETNTGFKITLLTDYVTGLDENDSVIIRYTATLNDAALTKTEGTNTNKAELRYSEQYQEDTVNVTTYKFQLVKDDKDNNLLTGAKFRLYDAETGGNEIVLKKVNTNGTEYYIINDVIDAEAVEIEAGTPVIKGLKAGDYWLEETQAPTGYNKLASRTKVTISTDNLASVSDGKYISGGIEVENNTGSVLPSTGGIGTTIFYVIGAILVIGAGILLVTRRRMSTK